MVGRPQTQRRNIDVLVRIDQPLGQWQAQQLGPLLMLRHQRVSLHELVVQADAQPRTVLNARGGIAVFQVHIDAGTADQEQVRRQIHGQRNGARLDTAGLQLLSVLLQLGEGHRPIGAHPVRRIIGLTRSQLFDLVHRDVLATEQNIALRDTFHRGDQIVVIAPLHQQQFDVRVIRMANHLHRRPVDRRIIPQEIRTLLVGGEDDGVLFRQLVVQRRERLTAPLCFAAEPRSQNACRALLSDIRLAGKHHRQDQWAVVAAVKKRLREMRQFVLHR
ncbi:hypothetical protein D3C72_991460 [compost metagenome]